jgi:hypothetical protein
MDIAAQVRAATLAATEAAREARAGIDTEPSATAADWLEAHPADRHPEAFEPCGFTAAECAAWRDELLSEPEPEGELVALSPDPPYAVDPLNPTDAELTAAIQRGLADGTLIDADDWLAREQAGKELEL